MRYTVRHDVSGYFDVHGPEGHVSQWYTEEDAWADARRRNASFRLRADTKGDGPTPLVERVSSRGTERKGHHSSDGSEPCENCGKDIFDCECAEFRTTPSPHHPAPHPQDREAG